jgi:hypothetical protein
MQTKKYIHMPADELRIGQYTTMQIWKKDEEKSDWFFEQRCAC